MNRETEKQRNRETEEVGWKESEARSQKPGARSQEAGVRIQNSHAASVSLVVFSTAEEIPVRRFALSGGTWVGGRNLKTVMPDLPSVASAQAGLIRHLPSW